MAACARVFVGVVWPCAAETGRQMQYVCVGNDLNFTLATASGGSRALSLSLSTTGSLSVWWGDVDCDIETAQRHLLPRPLQGSYGGWSRKPHSHSEVLSKEVIL